MTEQGKPTRRELLRPLHLLAIAGGAGLFAAFVTLLTTGGFTSRVYEIVASEDGLEGQHPFFLAIVIGGIAFIATLLLLSILLLAVDPVQATRRVDRPVLYDPEPDAAEDAPATDDD